MSRYKNTMGRLKWKHPLPKYRIKVSFQNEPVTKWRWEDKICLCWHLEGRWWLPQHKDYSGDWAPLQRASLSLSDKRPFRHLSELVQESSLVCSSYEDTATSGVPEAIHPLLRRASRELEKLRGVKATRFHQSILLRFFMLEQLSTVGTNFNYQQIYISRKKTILFAVCKTLVKGSWNEVRTGPAM